MTSLGTKISKTRAILSVLTPAAVILVIAWGALFLLQRQVGRPQKSGDKTSVAQIGATLPDFLLSAVDGTKAQISARNAKITLINFWATWCEACLEEMPSLTELHKTRKDKGLRVIAINLDEEPSKAISKTVKDFGIEFENYIDPDGKLSEIFDVHAIPLTVTVDESQRILEIHSGDRNWMNKRYLKKIDGWLQASSGDQANR